MQPAGGGSGLVFAGPAEGHQAGRSRSVVLLTSDGIESLGPVACLGPCGSPLSGAFRAWSWYLSLQVGFVEHRTDNHSGPPLVRHSSDFRT